MTMRKAYAGATVLCILSAPSWAGETCLNPQDATALKAASLQQELMVAALTCRDIEQYNHFVISYRAELQQSDKSLQAYFVRVNASTGQADYHAYKTRLANQSSLDSIHDPLYCAKAKAAFDEALESDKTSLADLVAQRVLEGGQGAQSCDQTAAASGGSFEIPAYTRTANRRN